MILANRALPGGDLMNMMQLKRRAAVAVAGAALATGLLPAGGCVGPWSDENMDNNERGHAARTGQLPGEDLVASAEDALSRGDKERALADFARAIEVNPTLTSAHLGMADIYRIDGDYNRAEQGYRRAAQIEPKNFDAQYYHGLMLHVMERVSEAIAAYLRALAIKPNDFQANLNLATAYFQLNENTQALPYAQRAVSLKPGDGPARFNLGAIYAALERHADAVVEYQQAAETMELDSRLLLNLAESLGRLERWSEMRNALERAVKTSPSAAAYERLGYALFKSKQFPEALTAFRQSLALDPNYFPALNGVGVSELNEWEWSNRKDRDARDRGLAALRRSLQLNRNQPRIEELLTRYRQ